MKEVDADLYEFLQNNETTLYKENNEIIASVFVYFYNLEDFCEIVGSYYFDDGGIEVQMMDGYLCVPINDYIEDCDHKISSYRACFADDVWEIYGDKILELEKED
jgi:hypothetical protein